MIDLNDHQRMVVENLIEIEEKLGKKQTKIKSDLRDECVEIRCWRK
jgi:hypothetical protein